MTDAEATSRRRIYIVDDQDFVVAMITKFLEAGNFDIRSTTDSAVAEQEIADWKPDAVIVDIMMPGLNGLEMIRRLKAEHGLQDSKFLIISQLYDAEIMMNDSQSGPEADKESYDSWFREKVLEALQDSRPCISHEDAMKQAQAVIDGKNDPLSVRKSP